MIDFPASPTVGQTYTFGGRIWEWTGSAWKRQINAGQIVSVFTLLDGLVEVTVTGLPYTIDGQWTDITYV